MSLTAILGLSYYCVVEIDLLCERKMLGWDVFCMWGGCESLGTRGSTLEGRNKCHSHKKAHFLSNP